MSGNRRIVLTEPGLCNTVFYEEIRRGNVHNGKVRMDKNGQVTQFRLNGILIDENPHYNDIAMITSDLNSTIKTEAGQYVYWGQQHHTLAEECYRRNFDVKIQSKCSPQLYDILTSRSCMNSPFLEFYKHKGQTAYDKNKQCTHTL